MKNIYICFESGDSVLMYAGEGLSVKDCRRFAEIKAGAVADAFAVSADELQFYCIGGRVWADTPELVEKVKTIINK